MKNTRQFLAALTLAAIYKAPSLSLWQMVKAALKIAWAMMGLGKKVDDATYRKRIECCEKCVLYVSSTETCGSPLADNPADGCWCHMETKARLASADCYLREAGSLKGWPDDIRPQDRD